MFGLLYQLMCEISAHFLTTEDVDEYVPSPAKKECGITYYKLKQKPKRYCVFLGSLFNNIFVLHCDQLYKKQRILAISFKMVKGRSHNSESTHPTLRPNHGEQTQSVENKVHRSNHYAKHSGCSIMCIKKKTHTHTHIYIYIYSFFLSFMHPKFTLIKK